MVEPNMMQDADARRVLTRPRGLVMALEPREPIRPPKVKIETTSPNWVGWVGVSGP
jgi:hypothetical protein